MANSLSQASTSALGKAVEQARLAGVRVAGLGDLEHARSRSARFPLQRRARRRDGLELAA